MSSQSHDLQPPITRSSSAEEIKVTETTSNTVYTPVKPESAAKEGEAAAVVVDDTEAAHDPIQEPTGPVKDVVETTCTPDEPSLARSTPTSPTPAAEPSHQLAPPAEPIRPPSQNSSQNSSEKRLRLNLSKSMQNLKKRKGSEVKTRKRGNSQNEKESIPPVPTLPGRPVVATAEKPKSFGFAAFFRKLTGQSSEKERCDKKSKAEKKKTLFASASKAVQTEDKVAPQEIKEAQKETKEIVPEEKVVEESKIPISAVQPAAQGPVDPCQIPLPPSPLVAPIILEPVIAPAADQKDTTINPQAQAMLSLEGFSINTNAPPARSSSSDAQVSPRQITQRAPEDRMPSPIRIPSVPNLRVKTPLSASSVGSTVDEDRLITPVESRSSAHGSSLERASVFAGRAGETKLQPRRSHSPPKTTDLSEMGMGGGPGSSGLASTKSKSWRRSMINLSSPLDRRESHKRPPTSHDACIAQQQRIKLNRVSCQPVIYRTGAEAVRGKMATMGMREEDEEVAETFFMS
ncbi:hypothetical protein L198_02799 [Cryptococcus wingfieldii CBS 7118]|uniref:Uncharacterized protein n=1 Tax=Cryptococcus wingfieldii CBS 7118 TaxID=1295528 RepID=A0A1E3JMI3_9TREE|nr:hypothetical protein L198_02799 [Cryptococcus wingfieldii CBS 7118]ODO02068.1 hypothetical protein L198_02799 [Cryptococcus wingfieldii CBS 7118]